MARGGKRPGAGRKAGSANKRSKQLEEQIAILARTKKPAEQKPVIGITKGEDDDALAGVTLPAGDDLMPLEFILCVLRSEEMPFSARMLAAEKAAPYCHNKLSTVEHKGGLDITTHEAALKELR